MKVGTIVKYADKWCREEERGERFFVQEWYDDINRGYIASLTTNCAFGYVEDVIGEMIVDCGRSIYEFSSVASAMKFAKEGKLGC